MNKRQGRIFVKKKRKDCRGSLAVVKGRHVEVAFFQTGFRQGEEREFYGGERVSETFATGYGDFTPPIRPSTPVAVWLKTGSN